MRAALPTPAEVPIVDVAAIDTALAGGAKALGKDTARLTLLLMGARESLVNADARTRGLQDQLSRQASNLGRTGTPTTLNPLDAARFLDDEQKELLFDAIARQRLGRLREQIAQADVERQTLHDELALVRKVARDLAQHPDLPPHVRAEVARALATLPLAAATVSHPRVLEYPDPEPAPPQPVPPQPAPEPAPVWAPPVTQMPALGSRALTDPIASAEVTPGRPPTGNEPDSRPVFVDPWGARTAAAPEPDALPSAPVYIDPYAPKPAAPTPGGTP